MSHIRSNLDINASPKRVWEVLTDFPLYGEWNPFIRSVEGVCEYGSVLRVRMELPGFGSSAFKARITRMQPSEELRWKGGLWLPGLFDGEHVFRMKEISSTKVRFVQEEFFAGLLVPFVFPSRQLSIREGFEKMNMALRDRAERVEKNDKKE